MPKLHIGLLAAGLLSLAACSSSGGGGQKDGSARDLTAEDLVATADGPPVCLGSIYPQAKVIDPDNPDFSDALHSKAEVIAKFAAAKTTNAAPYRAYKAAQAYAAELECAFCACGCAQLVQHKSAVDCFKDMHGFG